MRTPWHTHVGAGTLSLLVAAILVGACAGPSTMIEQTWTAPGAGPARFAHVVALYDGEDGTVRRSAEDRLARELAARGVKATPAYAVLTTAELASLEGAKATLRAAGYDGLVVMRMLQHDTQLGYMPGTFDAYWGAGWPHYGYGYAYGYGSPGYLYPELVVRVETTAYALADNRLVWSTMSRTIDPENTGALVEEVTELVANELGRRGVVMATQPMARPPQG